jgi:topoisomerase-4 subunit A
VQRHSQWVDLELEGRQPLRATLAGKLKGERLESCRGNRGGKGKPVKAPRK